MCMITVVGVGLRAGDLTLTAVNNLRCGDPIILHTRQIGCADWLEENGIAFSSLDGLYETCDDFDQHARLAAEAVLSAAAGEQNVVYAVYDVRDRSVLKLTELAPKGTHVAVIAGVPVEGALCAFADGAVRTLEASDWENYHLTASDNALIREINSRALASEVKLKLMECYPDEAQVRFLDGDGRISRIPLYDLDRMKRYDHRSCALVLAERDLMKLQRYTFDDLLRVMQILQGPDGCPWDKAQTHESLRTCMLEETYEAIDAINEGDMDHLYDELGDLLMQITMQAEIGRRCGEFDIIDATTSICEKMIRRHSHIFGADSADSPDSVLDLWTRNKMKERGQKKYVEVLREVRRSLPALSRAAKLCDKAGRAGVKCTDANALLEDAKRCTGGVIAADNHEMSVGDALFALCALAQRIGVDPELALNSAADRFVSRFDALEQTVGSIGETSDEVKDYWKQVKL